MNVFMAVLSCSQPRRKGGPTISQLGLHLLFSLLGGDFGGRAGLHPIVLLGVGGLEDSKEEPERWTGFSEDRDGRRRSLLRLGKVRVTLGGDPSRWFCFPVWRVVTQLPSRQGSPLLPHFPRYTAATAP